MGRVPGLLGLVGGAVGAMISGLSSRQLPNPFLVGGVEMGFEIYQSPFEIWLVAPFLARRCKYACAFKYKECQSDYRQIGNGFARNSCYSLDFGDALPEILDRLIWIPVAGQSVTIGVDIFTADLTVNGLEMRQHVGW